MTSYDMLGGWKAAVDAVKVDLKAAADSVAHDPLSLIKGTSIGTPAAYGDNYVWWMLFRLTTSGQSEAAERFMPDEVIAQVLCVLPATNPGTAFSGRAYAEDRAEEAFATWIDRLWDLEAIMTRSSGNVYVASTAAGSQDEFGRAMFLNEQRNALWAYSAELHVKL